MLLGRDRELEEIAALLDRARGGTSGVLALVGEAGIGKSSRLEWAAGQAGAMNVLRAGLDVTQGRGRGLSESGTHLRGAVRAVRVHGSGLDRDRLGVRAAATLRVAALPDRLFAVLLDQPLVARRVTKDARSSERHCKAT